MNKKGKTSAIWNHFTEPEPKKAQCNYCTRIISISSGNGSNLNRHLKHRHPEMALAKKYSRKVPSQVEVLKRIPLKQENLSEVERLSEGNGKMEYSVVLEDWLPAKKKAIEVNSNTKSTKTKEDVYDKFGKYVAAQLRSLPSKTATVTQLNIQNVITMQVIKNLTANKTPT